MIQITKDQIQKAIALAVLWIGVLACGPNDAPQNCDERLPLTSQTGNRYTYSSHACSEFLREGTGYWQASLSLNNRLGLGKITSFVLGDISFDLSDISLVDSRQKVFLPGANKQLLLPLEYGGVSLTIALPSESIRDGFPPLYGHLLIERLDY